MPQHFQQAALPMMQSVTPAASSPPVTVAGHVAPAQNACAPEKDYVKWHRMKRAGFWRWFLLHSIFESGPSVVAQAILQTVLSTGLSRAIRSGKHSVLDIVVLFAGRFTLMLLGMWVFMAVIVWFTAKRGDTKRRAALLSDPAPSAP